MCSSASPVRPRRARSPRAAGDDTSTGVQQPTAHDAQVQHGRDALVAGEVLDGVVREETGLPLEMAVPPERVPDRTQQAGTHEFDGRFVRELSPAAQCVVGEVDQPIGVDGIPADLGPAGCVALIPADDPVVPFELVDPDVGVVLAGLVGGEELAYRCVVKGDPPVPLVEEPAQSGHDIQYGPRPHPHTGERGELFGGERGPRDGEEAEEGPAHALPGGRQGVGRAGRVTDVLHAEAVQVGARGVDEEGVQPVEAVGKFDRIEQAGGERGVPALDCVGQGAGVRRQIEEAACARRTAARRKLSWRWPAVRTAARTGGVPRAWEA